MKIRNATHADIDAILDIFNYELIHTPYVYSYKPFTKAYMITWYDQKIIDGHPLIVAEIDGLVVGYATYGKFRDRAAYSFTKEYSIYIHRDFRHQRIGKELLKELIQIALSKNVHSFIGGVDAKNLPSIKFHKKMGFTEVAHFKEIAFKFDQWLDLKFFQLILRKDNGS